MPNLPQKSSFSEVDLPFPIAKGASVVELDHEIAVVRLLGGEQLVHPQRFCLREIVLSKLVALARRQAGELAGGASGLVRAARGAAGFRV